MRKVLVTGGAGFIGSRLALRLHAEGAEVTVLDTLSPQIHGADPEKSPLYRSIIGKVRFLRGSVTSAAELADAIEGQQVIVHLAAETGTGQSMYQVDRYTQVNIGGTSLLLDMLASKKSGVERIVVASSRSIYGEGKYLSKELGAVYPEHRAVADMERGDFTVKYPGCTEPLELVATDEESKIHPSSVYGITKQVQEQLVMTVCTAIGIAPVALRYQNVFGPGQSLSNPYTGILSIFSNLIMGGKPINIFEDGTESRDFVFIDDVVDATVRAIHQDKAAGEVFNVGTGVPTSVLKVAQALMAQLGGDSPIVVTGNFRIGDIRHNFASLDKARRLIGFSPAYDFETGLALFCKWVRSIGRVESDYDNSLREMKARGLMK